MAGWITQGEQGGIGATATPGDCIEARGIAVSAIGAPESWSPGWKPANTWADYRDIVEKAIACSPYDMSQIASMRAGVARTEACYPCTGVQITTSGPCGPPDPATIAHDLAHGIDPNPPIWAHCGPPKPLSYYQQIAAPYVDALKAMGQTPLTLGGGVAAQPWINPQILPATPIPSGPSYTPTAGPQEHTVTTVDPTTGQVTVSPSGLTPTVDASGQVSFVAASGGSPATFTAPGGVVTSTQPTATSPGVVTSLVSTIFGSPVLLIALAVGAYFIFFRRK